MTRTAKIVFVAALLTGLAGGWSSGYKAASDQLNAATAVREQTVPVDLAQYAYMQYGHAGPDEARAALQFLVTFLQEIEALRPAQFRERDLAVAYTSLALVEDAAQRPEQSRAAMAEARRWFAAGAGGNAMSEEEMKSSIRALDDLLPR